MLWAQGISRWLAKELRGVVLIGISLLLPDQLIARLAVVQSGAIGLAQGVVALTAFENIMAIVETGLSLCPCV